MDCIVDDSDMKEEKELITDNHSWRIGKNGRIHRRRRKVFPNGDVYNCEFVDNRPDGYGTLVTSKGMQYEGSFQNGLFHGPGTIILNAEVDVKVDVKVEKIEQFVGEFKHGKKHGYGTLHRYLDGEKWEGYFMDDVLNGKGSFWRASTGEHRKGTWHNGILHCEDGSIIFENGDTYNGPVFLGKMHGDVGHYTYAGNQGYYTGQHQRNTKEGIGTRHFCDGSTFRGDFKNGQMSGHGSFTYENGLDSRDRYIGDWKDGLYQGYGELYFKDFCDVSYYKGHFDQGMFSAKGHLHYRDGGYYEGGFHAIITKERVLKACYSMFGQRHGSGKRVWASGNTFEGEWKNDSMQEGRYFNAFHQSIFIGTFEHGKKHGMGRETWRSSNGKIFLDPCLRWKHPADGICKYSGDYKDGYCHGNGIFQAPDGRQYDGQWCHGKPNGLGTITLLRDFEYGDPSRLHIGKYGSLYRPAKYEGCFKDGKKHGIGRLIFADGSRREEKFNEGVLIE